MKQSNYCVDGRTAVCTGVEWIAKRRPKNRQKAILNGNLIFWTRSGESAEATPVVLDPDRCIGGRLPAKRGPNGVVNQARVAHKGHLRGTSGASQCFHNPRGFGTTHCRHHFSDIVG